MIRPSQRFFSRANLDPRLKRGLVAHWIGGGSGTTWSDRSGYGHHAGDLPTGASWAIGQSGSRNALRLDGANSYVPVAVPVGYPSGPLAVTDWCCSAWIKLPLDHGTGFVGRIATEQSGNYWGIVIRNRQFTALSARDGITYPVGASYGPDLNDGRWHHVAAVRDTVAGVFSYYLDGQLTTITAITDTGANNGNSFQIGSNGASEYFYGDLDDVRVYNRALSASEIALLGRRSFRAVTARRWYAGRPPSTTAATSSVSTWVSPTASTRASVAASPSIASWASPTASTKASVSASPAVSTWVVPNATTRTPRIMPTVGASRTVYDPIEVS